MTAEVLKYDTNGNRLFSWDASGTGAGRIRRTAPVLGRLEGNVYTADNVLGRPQKLTPKPGADPTQLIGPPKALMTRR